MSPLVAPTTVKDSGCSAADLRAFLLSRKNSNRLPRSCSATSLNEKVGPWKSSRMAQFRQGRDVGVSECGCCTIGRRKDRRWPSLLATSGVTSAPCVSGMYKPPLLGAGARPLRRPTAESNRRGPPCITHHRCIISYVSCVKIIL